MLARNRGSIRCIPQLAGVGRQASSRPIRHEPLDRQAADVVPGDLAATLDAHRRSNLALKIRRSTSPRKSRWRYSNEHVGSGTLLQAPDDPTSPDPAAATHAHQIDSGPEANPVHYKRKVIGHCGEFVVGHTTQNHTPHLPAGWEELGVEIRELVNLESCLKSFASWIRLSERELRLRHRLAAFLIDIMNTSKPSLRFELHGSLDHGLATPLSDINVAFCRRGVKVPTLEPSLADRDGKAAREAASSVHRLPQKLYRAGFKPRAIHASEGERVVCLEHKATGLWFNLRWETRLSYEQTLARRLMKEHAHFTPLYLILRTSLDMRGLLDWKTAGVGSYMLVTMLAAYFDIAAHTSPRQLSESLWGFLDFYGDLDGSRHQISHRPGRSHHPEFYLEGKTKYTKEKLKRRRSAGKPYMVSVDPQKSKRPYLLRISDPLSDGKDLGKHAHRILDVRQTFRVLARMSRNITRNNEKSTEKLMDPLAPFVGHRLAYIDDKRQSILRGGSLKSSTEVTSEHDTREAGIGIVNNAVDSEAQTKTNA